MRLEEVLFPASTKSADIAVPTTGKSTRAHCFIFLSTGVNSEATAFGGFPRHSMWCDLFSLFAPKGLSLL
ncbi:hypothetical protein [Fischerella muscicola]|uniref:hypothetical protein n=1 Tax=Fischerella muscicola TaxID=92938 RepID=UPI0015E13036|nr:hypothetical protein [Fischerella muscicola]